MAEEVVTPHLRAREGKQPLTEVEEERQRVSRVPRRAEISGLQGRAIEGPDRGGRHEVEEPGGLSAAVGAVAAVKLARGMETGGVEGGARGANRVVGPGPR
jgi:hypothetical protein